MIRNHRKRRFLTSDLDLGGFLPIRIHERVTHLLSFSLISATVVDGFEYGDPLT